MAQDERQRDPDVGATACKIADGARELLSPVWLLAVQRERDDRNGLTASHSRPSFSTFKRVLRWLPRMTV